MKELSQLTREELPAATEVLHRFYEEGKLPGKMSDESFVRSWGSFLRSDTGTIIAEKEDGKITGLLGAILFPDLNNGDLVATEAFWYVDPQHRGGGIKLFNRFEEWGKARGAKRLIMVHLLSSMPEALNRFYKRRGYRPVEVNYVKEID